MKTPKALVAASLLLVVGNASGCLTQATIDEYVSADRAILGDRSTTTPTTVTNWMNSRLAAWAYATRENKERMLKDMRAAFTPEVLRKYAEPGAYGLRQGVLEMKLLECHLGLKSGEAIRSPTPDSTTTPRSANAGDARRLSEVASNSAREFAAQKSADAQGKPKKHDPAAEAHHCVSLDRSDSLFGGFRNSCAFKVNVSWCTHHPKKDSWAEWHDCRKPGGQLNTVDAGSRAPAHTRNAEFVYWFACKAPASPSDTEYVAGQGIRGRCR